jgi:hypothetical protein
MSCASLMQAPTSCGAERSSAESARAGELIVFVIRGSVTGTAGPYIAFPRG